jgi:hypothetical protein
MRRYVLIFHSGALGDFVLTWPLAMALGRLHPQSRIVYITSGSKGALAEKALGVEWKDGEGGWHRLYEPGGTLPDPAMKVLTEAHSIYTFVSGGASNAGGASAESVWMSNVRRLAPAAKIMELEPRPPNRHAESWSDFLIEQLAAMPAVAESVRQMIGAVNQRGVRVGAPAAVASTGEIVIHPGAGAPKKCWPVQRYVELAGRIKQQLGRVVRILIGEVEAQTWDTSTTEKLKAVAKVVHPATYLELMAELNTAAGYVGNDSGPTHLAGMIGLATVALFGPTDPLIWRPLGPRVECLSSDPIETISVDSAMEKLVAVLRK